MAQIRSIRVDVNPGRVILYEEKDLSSRRASFQGVARKDASAAAAVVDHGELVNSKVKSRD